MSTVPFCSRGMRFCDVTGTYFTSSLRPAAFSASATMRWHTSTWKPANLLSPSVNESAPDDSRTPMVMTPEPLTLASVSLAWARALPAASVVMARASKCFFMQIS